MLTLQLNKLILVLLLDLRYSDVVGLFLLLELILMVDLLILELIDMVCGILF